MRKARAALFENLQFLQPSHKGMGRGVRLFFALRVLHLVQDFIALVDPRSNLLLARKARRVVEVADDPTVLSSWDLAHPPWQAE